MYRKSSQYRMLSSKNDNYPTEKEIHVSRVVQNSNFLTTEGIEYHIMTSVILKLTCLNYFSILTLQFPFQSSFCTFHLGTSHFLQSLPVIFNDDHSIHFVRKRKNTNKMYVAFRVCTNSLWQYNATWASRWNFNRAIFHCHTTNAKVRSTSG